MPSTQGFPAFGRSWWTPKVLPSGYVTIPNGVSPPDIPSPDFIAMASGIAPETTTTAPTETVTPTAPPVVAPSPTSVLPSTPMPAVTPTATDTGANLFNYSLNRLGDYTRPAAAGSVNWSDIFSNLTQGSNPYNSPIRAPTTGWSF